MKKIFLALLAATLVSFTGMAQQTPAKKEAKTPATHLKKDGTADKRFKANKTDAAATKHLKKDGTPDKRYKENQPVKKKN